jgi:hypothetical protein
VTGCPEIRFYAGAVIQDADGFTLGSLCVIDTPRALSDKQKNALKLLANQVVYYWFEKKKFRLKIPN